MKMFLIQLIGAIGYLVFALSYYKKKKSDILIIQIFANFIFAFHYYLLDAKTGIACNIFNVITLTIIYLFEKKQKKKYIAAISIIPIIIAITIISYQNVYSVFPVIATIIAIISFLTNSENTIRKIGIVSAICWLIYAIVYKSYVAIVFEILLIISTVIAYFKNKK